MKYENAIVFFEALRVHLRKNLNAFDIGSINRNDLAFSLLPLTNSKLRAKKLKFVIIFNHKDERFEICLSGQNKTIRKNTWQIFQEGRFTDYHVAESIDDCLRIVDHIVAEEPNFEDPEKLKKELEAESLKFTDLILDFLKAKLI